MPIECASTRRSFCICQWEIRFNFVYICSLLGINVSWFCNNFNCSCLCVCSIAWFDCKAERKKMFVSDFMMMMKADDWNWTVDSCNCVQVDSVVQCVDVAVAPQEFDSCLPETTDQWKCCCMDYIHEFSRWPWHVH